MILIFLKENYVAQVFSFLILSLLFQCLMIKSKPFSETLDNRMNLFIEFAVSIYLYAQLGLTDFMGHNELREELGWVQACLIIGVVAINVLVFAGTLMSSGLTKIKRFL